MPEIRNKHDAIVAREKAADIREHAIAQREAAARTVETELAARDAQLQAETERLTIQKGQIDAERGQLATQKAQVEADGIMLEKARAEMAQARAEFDAQVMQAKQAYELFSVQRDTFAEERARWEQEGPFIIPGFRSIPDSTDILVSAIKNDHRLVTRRREVS